VATGGKNEQRAPTIIDVAREVGVSKSTISRVLNGSASVSPETEERVLAAMERLGYRTNQAARSLRTRKSALVGVLVPSLNEVYGRQAEGVDAVLRDAGVLTVISCFGWSVQDCLQTMTTLIGRGIDGLILALPDDRDPRIQRAVLESPVPLVILDREVPGAIYDSVMTDQFPGMSAAVTHLSEVGRHRIGLIAMTPRTRPGRTALAAYSQSLGENGLEYRPDLIVQTDTFDGPSGAAAAEYLLSKDVDAILSATPMSALAGVLHQLGDAGVSFPDDVSLIGFHENELSLAKHPRLSVINRSVGEIGEVAGQMMLRRLADPAQPAMVETLPTWFVAGESSDPRDLS
jgi:LacI family transcriptional regulator